MNSWYFTKDGGQEGPVTASQLVALANASVLDPATTLVWREGLANWITLAQSPLFDEAASAPAMLIPPAKSLASMNPYAVSSGTLAAPRASRPSMPLEYPGFGRLAYFLSSMGVGIVFYAILVVIIFTAFRADSGGGMAAGVLLVAAMFAGVFLFLGVKRVTNLGMSGWAVLWAFVPIMNVWIHWRMMACPAGYEEHRTLDTAGKVISGLWIGMLALGFLAPLVGAIARG
jgi:hypothetical protein